jgi:hypothetical protein
MPLMPSKHAGRHSIGIARHTTADCAMKPVDRGRCKVVRPRGFESVAPRGIDESQGPLTEGSGFLRFEIRLIRVLVYRLSSNTVAMVSS